MIFFLDALRVKLQFVNKTFVLSIFEWPLKTGFTVLSFLFSNKMLLIATGIHKLLVRIANREDPGQTAFSEAG